MFFSTSINHVCRIMGQSPIRGKRTLYLHNQDDMRFLFMILILVRAQFVCLFSAFISLDYLERECVSSVEPESLRKHPRHCCAGACARGGAAVRILKGAGPASPRSHRCQQHNHCGGFRGRSIPPPTPIQRQRPSAVCWRNAWWASFWLPECLCHALSLVYYYCAGVCLMA